MNQKGRGLQATTAVAKGSTASEGSPATGQKSKQFDSFFIGTAQQAVDFISNILESSTEYSVIAKDLERNILLWNEGARRLYGYKPDEVVGKANSSILHVSEDVAAAVPNQIMRMALEKGKWEGPLARQRKNGDQFTARVLITPRCDVLVCRRTAC
jgi:PAS domain S-box-containing protein